MTTTSEVQPPSPYERGRRRSNALLLALDPRPVAQTAQVTVTEVPHADDEAALEDMFVAVPLTPPPRSPNSGALIMPDPLQGRRTPPPGPQAARVPLPAPAEPSPPSSPRPARPVPRTSRHFGIHVGATTTQALQACGPYLTTWLQTRRVPEPLIERVTALHRRAKRLATATDDISVLYSNLFCMTLEHQRLLSIGRNAVLQQSFAAPACGDQGPYAQVSAMAEMFQNNIETVSAALDVFVNVADCCAMMAEALAGYTRRTGMWAPDPNRRGAPPLFAALYSSQQQAARHLCRIERDLLRWGEDIGTQVRLLGCCPPDAIAPNTVFAAMRHLQPLSLGTAMQLPPHALHFDPQIAAATQLRECVHYTREFLQAARIRIDAGWGVHVAHSSDSS